MQDNIYFTECLKSNLPTLATPVPTLVKHASTLATPPTPHTPGLKGAQGIFSCQTEGLGASFV